MIGDAIASVVGKIIDRAWPDPTQKAQIDYCRTIIKLEKEE